MKVLVLGATDGTGRLLVRDALAKGHSVVALVRSKTPERRLSRSWLCCPAEEQALRCHCSNHRWRRLPRRQPKLPSCREGLSSMRTCLIETKVDAVTADTKHEDRDAFASGLHPHVLGVALNLGDDPWLS
jgi:NAD(P)-dependent dehydrogenase (short-subunit alcohol dehydrogenase family)